MGYPLLRLHKMVWIRKLDFEVLETRQIRFLRPLVSHLMIVYIAEQLQSRGGESMTQWKILRNTDMYVHCLSH